MTAKQGTTLPFDLVDIPVIFWHNQGDLKSKLRECLSAIAVKYGR